MKLHGTALAALLLSSGGCQAVEVAPDIAAPEAGARQEVLHPGVIRAASTGDSSLRVPPSARAGEPFTVTVTTFGSSSCTRPGGAEVEIEGLLAEVTPMDWVPADPLTPCTRDLRSFPREVSVLIDRAGEATIRAHGRGSARMVDGSLVYDEISIEARVRITQ